MSKMYEAELPWQMTEEGKFIKPVVRIKLEPSDNNNTNLARGWGDAITRNLSGTFGKKSPYAGINLEFKPVKEDV